MSVDKSKQISSLAAPSAEDLERLRAMSAEERRAVLAQHLAEGRADLKDGRVTDLSSEEDVQAFFDALRARHEAPAH
ncbi:MAG: hypothetical protein AAF668_06580 [Pseudomonadota bacterium]